MLRNKPPLRSAPLSQQAARQHTQRENRATVSNPTLRACLLCLLRLAAAAAGRRGVGQQVWRVLLSKVAAWREQWSTCLLNNRPASHELYSSPSAHHALNFLSAAVANACPCAAARRNHRMDSAVSFAIPIPYSNMVPQLT